MEKYPPSMDDLERLVHPTVDDDKQGRGYQRYATAKLAITTWMYALNRHLEDVRALFCFVCFVSQTVPSRLPDHRDLLFSQISRMKI